MKQKEYRLPKEFAEKWMTALRDGSYKQGQSQLHNINENSYCCLGVACHLLGVNSEVLGKGLSYDDDCDISYGDNGYPKDIQEDPFEEAELLHDEFFFNTVASLNDGAVFYWDKEKRINISYIDRELPNPNKIVINEEKKKYSFKEIANWIEENVEFYE